MPKFKIEEIKSWEQYLEAHSTDIPAGKENEYVAKALIAYKNKNADPQIPYSQKKAEKDASQMMKNPLFIQEMQNNKPEILAMMQQGQYDKVVDKTVPPIPFKKETIEKAYESLFKSDS